MEIYSSNNTVEYGQKKQINWKWVVPLGCFGGLVLMAGFIASIFIIVFSLLKNSDVYQDSFQKASTHPTVTEKIGTPIEEGWYVLGNISTSNSSGNADLTIPITGPLGGATIYVIAHKRAGDWVMTVQDVKIESTGEVIDLLQR